MGKFSVKAMGIAGILAVALHLAGAAPEVAWEFDPSYHALEQGMLIRNFNSVKILDDGVLKLAAEWKKDSPSEPFLRSCNQILLPFDSRDLGNLELRLRANVSKQISGAGIGLRVRLNWFKGGNSEQQILLNTDGEFHSYQIDFSKFQHPENSRGFYLYVFPLENVDKATGWASVELDWLRIGFSQPGAVRNICKIADEKLSDLENLQQSLLPYGMTLKKAADGLRRLRAKRAAIDSESNPAKQYETAMALDEEFNRIHRLLRIGRRLKESLDELRMMERSAERNGISSELTASLRATLAPANAALERGELETVQTLLNTADGLRDEFWNTLAGKMPDRSDVWQSGVDRYSTGLFGWDIRTREGLVFSVEQEQLRRGFFRNRDGSRTSLSIRPAGDVFSRKPPEVLETDWTSSEFSWLYRNAGGKPVGWNIAVNRLAPGILLTTETDSVRFAVNARQDFRPNRVLVPCRDGVKLLTPEELASFPWREMSENWLLLLCDNGLPSVPWLLTLQHRPASAEVSGDALCLSFPEQAGTIGIANLYGVRPLPPDWSGEWKSPPGEVIRQSRRLNAVMTAFPWSCEEFFTVNREDGICNIENRFGYRRVKNDWNYQGEEYAPLPPVLVMAAGKEYPVALPEDAVDYEFSTIYGPWRAVPGNHVTYTLPLPDLREELSLKTEHDPERQQRSRRWRLSLPDFLYHFSPAHNIDAAWVSHLAGFNLYTKDEKDSLLKNLQAVLDRYYTKTWDDLGRLRLPHYTHLHGERTEPFTGKSYLAYGWRSRQGNQLDYRDISDFAGFHLLPTLRYAQLSGDWELIRKHWPRITELYGVMPRRCEWASMAVGSADRSLVHGIDMGPDSWISSEVVAKLAAQMNDRRTEELALCIAAKQAVPLCAALMKRGWDMSFDNNWDWKNQIPELGYFDQSYIHATRWDDSYLALSGVTGIVHTPSVLRLYNDFSPKAIRLFLQRLETAYPQWNDYKHIRAGKKRGENGPLTFFRQLMLRDMLGEQTGKLEELLRKGLFDDDEFSVWNYNVSGGFGIVNLSVAGGAMLAGRDAPLHLAGWGRAALLDGQYNFSTGIATLEFTSADPFVLQLTSAVNPARVTVNGRSPEPGVQHYGQEEKLLSLSLDRGKQRVELHYPGWEPPRREVSTRQEEAVPLTPEMKLCATEQELYRASQGVKTQGDFNCGKTVPVPLNRFHTLSREARQGWVGIASGAIPSGDNVLRGVPMRLAAGAVGVGTGQAGGLPRQVNGIAAEGRWKRLFFLHLADRNGTPGEVRLRYRIHYADGAQELFDVRSELELSDWRNSADLPNGKAALALSGNKGEKGNAFLSVWENPARDEIAGVVAEFQREYKEIKRIDLEFTGQSGSAILLALTGEPAAE